jgi:hypothetical protein
MELTFTREDVPKITRIGGSGREAEPWETHLAPLKDTPGESFRVWTYEKRTSAVSRMSSVRERLTKAVPTENWNLAVRTVPGTGAENPELYGVYISFAGTFTAEQVAENVRKHDERSNRVKAARAKRAAEEATEEASTTIVDPFEETEAAPSAKERVQQARNAQKAKAS